jgi:non-ribosomal peptide synthetase component E (peptide arylation enzyme)
MRESRNLLLIKNPALLKAGIITSESTYVGNRFGLYINVNGVKVVLQKLRRHRWKQKGPGLFFDLK